MDPDWRQENGVWSDRNDVGSGHRPQGPHPELVEGLRAGLPVTPPPMT